MTQFAVTVPELTRSAESARSAGAQLTSELDRLAHRADAVLTERWLGAAAEAFDRAWNDWHAAARGVVSELAALAEEVQTCAAAYRLGDASGEEVLWRAAS